jgi:hypothetical protein
MKVSGQSDRWIQPGKTEQYVVSVAVGQRHGKITKVVTATTNDRDNASVSLTCEANVLSAMNAEPENINLGSVKRDAGVQTTVVKISRGDSDPLKPKVLTTGNPQVQAELKEIEPGEKYEVTVTATPPWPDAVLRGALQIETGIEQEPVKNIPIYATMLPRLQTVPQRFTLRADTPSELKLIARLNWDDDKPGKVLEASVNDPQLTARLEDQNNQQVVVLEVPAGYKAAPSAGTQVTLKTDDPAVPTFQVPVFVMGQQPQPAAPGIAPQARGAVQPGALAQPARLREPTATRAPSAQPAANTTAQMPTSAPAQTPEATPAPAGPK